MSRESDFAAVSALLRELEREIKADLKLVGRLAGTFEVNITVGGKPVGTWYMVLSGQLKTPEFGEGRAPGKPSVSLTLEEKDLIKLVSGALSGRKAHSQNRLAIKGDYDLAQEMEDLFIRAGGPQKAELFIRRNSQLFASKL